MKPSLMDHCVTGAIGTCTKTGWINEKAFSEWFAHFLKEVQPQTKPEPVLLIFDGHASHTRNLNIIEQARNNNVVLLCLPSHTSHRLQPLDVSFFRSLKSKFDEEVRLWLRNHAGRRLCEDQISELFCHAYQKVASIKNAVSGFRKSGIEPFNRELYKDADYSGTLMTYRPPPVPVDDANPTLSENDDALLNPVESVISAENNIATYDSVTEAVSVPNETVSQGTSSIENDNEKNNDLREALTTAESVSNVSFQELVDYHRDEQPVSGRKKRKVAYAEVLTSSPYKENLKASYTERCKRDEKKCSKKRSLRKTTENPKKSGKRQRNSEQRGGKKAKDVEDATPCSACLVRFCDDRSGSQWIQCQQCSSWFHNTCQGLPDKPQRTFICIECSDN